MRVQILTNTPAHAHLYRHAVTELRDRGHEVLVLARDYGCTLDLLEYHDLPHVSYGRCGTSQRSLFLNLPGQYARLVRRTLQFDPDVILGMGAYAAHAGAIAREPTVLVLDSEPTSLDHRISRPFARSILTPAAFQKDLGDRHYVFEGFKESAYLHPSVFSPDPSVRAELGVGPDERFVLVRFNAFGSHHDVGRGGFTPQQRRQLVRQLADRATVLVSDEGGDADLEDLPARPYDCHPARLHDALAAADLLVADTQTMVTEAALIGTPAIRSNAFVGEDDMGNFLALEEAGLVYNLASFEAVLSTAGEVLANGTAEAITERRDRYVTDMIDLTDVLVQTALARGRMDAVDGVRER
jgi:predicted glycosyltransferase